MKKTIVVIALIVSVLSCKKETKAIEVKEKNDTIIKKDEMPKKKVLSPHATAMAIIGDAHIHIDYSSPGVRDRIIFGGLLSYDMVWQAGKYGFFTIPSKKEWTIIFNTNWDQHGKDDYDEKEDVLRFKVKSILSETTTEHLEYKVKKKSDTEGSISLAWEKVLIDFNFTVKQ
jgi:hypothetical protein